MSHQQCVRVPRWKFPSPAGLDEAFSTPWFNEALGITLAFNICFAGLGEIISVIEGINVLATWINLSAKLSGTSTEEWEWGLEMRIWDVCSEPNSDLLACMYVNNNIPCRNSAPCLGKLVMLRRCYCWCQVPVVEQPLHETSDRCDKRDPSLPPSFLLNLLQQTVWRWKDTSWGFQGNGTVQGDWYRQLGFYLIK